MERYEEEAGRYVLYLEGVRDALRAVQPTKSTAGWLLLEGRPALGALNRALRGKLDIHELHLAFTKGSAQRLARELIARLLRKT